MIDELENKIKSFWHGTPAVVTVREIKRRSEFPKWEDCEKDHLYVGIRRGQRWDKVLVVKHQMEMECKLRCHAEKLRERDWFMVGAKPDNKNMTCLVCGEFSTRMNVGQICQDCTSKREGMKK